jgi:hypothetical protein
MTDSRSCAQRPSRSSASAVFVPSAITFAGNPACRKRAMALRAMDGPGHNLKENTSPANKAAKARRVDCRHRAVACRSLR